jgi:ketosteroid isomerase-like protein
MTPIRMTRRDLLLTGLTLLLFVGPARAQTPAPVSQADRQAIRRVIESQLAAFQRDDGPGAFAFASPMIREIFATPENFMAMVKSAYQPVYRPREVAFRELAMLEGAPAQEVYLVGPDGQTVIALYVMERQPDGSWRINGVYLLQVPGETT